MAERCVCSFEREAAFKEAAPYGGRSLLHCYSDVMEGRGDGLKRLNLGRSIDHSCKGFQHFWVSIGVVCFCIGLALPQTDRNHIQASGQPLSNCPKRKSSKSKQETPVS